ncbi:hypothetical protein K439DRAFT_1642004 [Ramaria rubella]|nr:hypothetical protein K439DRAFT_1642999 [Ramaria rubella]KAF8574734.1 hypothetical protein K439DRAFT_1642004 [Ramaria rubella]
MVTPMLIRSHLNNEVELPVCPTYLCQQRNNPFQKPCVYDCARYHEDLKTGQLG